MRDLDTAPEAPTDDDVRECYAMSGDGLDFKRAAQERGEAFDRWHAATRQAAIDAAHLPSASAQLDAAGLVVGECSRCAKPVLVPQDDPDNREMQCCPTCTRHVCHEQDPTAADRDHLARAIYETFGANESWAPWETRSEDSKERWRKHADRVLALLLELIVATRTRAQSRGNVDRHDSGTVPAPLTYDPGEHTPQGGTVSTSAWTTLHESADPRTKGSGQQQYTLTRTLRHTSGRKVFVNITIDSSYPSQSRLTVQLWDGDKWNGIVGVLGTDPAVTTDAVSSYSRDHVAHRAYIERLVADLLSRAEQVID